MPGTIPMLAWSRLGAGPPVILLPGAACGRASWGVLPERLASQYTVHIASVAGFAGALPSPRPDLTRAIDELALYMANLDHPALIGHSLGGTLALAAAARAPAGPVLLIEAAPWLAPIAYGSLDPAVHDARVEALRRRAADEASFAAGIVSAFATMLARPAEHRALLEEAAASHAASVAELTASAMRADLRAGLRALDAPLHLLVGDWAGTHDPAARVAAFEAQVRLHAASVTVLPDCRHFPMIEQPEPLARWALERLVP